MKITAEAAEKMDYFLGLGANAPYYDYEASSTEEHKLNGIYIRELENLGHIDIQTSGGNSFEYIVTPRGKFFYSEGGFRKLYKEQQEEEEHRKNEASLTKKQINAAKREPYYIAFIVLSTIANILLAIFK